MTRSYILFSSIGLYLEKHPIFQVTSQFPIVSRIHLFSSDEPHPENKPQEESVEANIEHIRGHFSKLSMVPIKITVDYYKMQFVQENSFKMAATIINLHQEFPDHDILLDLSAARVPIKLALSRAGEIVHDYFSTATNRPQIICALRPVDYPDVISYPIKNLPLPSSKDQQLLQYLARHGKQVQRKIYRDLHWKNQGEVSKSLGRLHKLGYVNRDKQVLTNDGRDVLEFIERIRN